MKQLQFYNYATWGLLVLNLSLVAFFFLTKPEHFPPPRDEEGRDGKGRAVAILKLDKQQQVVFSDYAEQHIQQMQGFDHQQRSLLKPYFNTLIDSAGNIETDSLLVQSSQLERKKIETTYQHMQKVKSILKPEQQAYFEAFMVHVLKIILPEQNNQPPPPPKGH